MKKPDKNCMDSRASFWQKHHLFILFVLFGLLIRCIFISFQSLSNDELSAWSRAVDVSWGNLWYSGIRNNDMHPGFYQVFLWLWMKVFGAGEWSIRSTSLLFFILNCVLIYRICLDLKSKTTVYFVLAYFVALSYFVVNTTYARPYNSGLFFILLSILSLIHLHLELKVKWHWYVLLIIGFAGCMYSHYFAFLVAGTLGVFAVIFLKKKVAIFICGTIALLLFIPHLEITTFHLQQGGLGWLGKPEWNWLFLFLYEMLNNSWFFVVLAIFYILRYGFRLQVATKIKRWIIVWFIASYYLAYFISIFFTPILREAVMMFTIVPLLIAVFKANEPSVFVKGNAKPAILLCILFAAHSFFFGTIIKPTPNGVFKQLANDFSTVNYNGENAAINTCNIVYFNYYANQKVKEPIKDWFENTTEDKLRTRVENSTANNFIYAWTNSFHVPMYLEIIRRKYSNISKYKNYPNGAFYEFKEGKTENNLSKVPAKILSKNFEKDTSNSEFSYDLKFKLKGEKSAGHLYYLLEYTGTISDSIPTHLVVVIDQSKEEIEQGEKQKLYAANNMATNINSSKLVKHFVVFELNSDIDCEQILHAYVYNPGHNKIYIQNFQLYEVIAK